LEMKLYMFFRTVRLSIVRSYSLYTERWYMPYRSVDSFRAGSGWNCSPDPARKLSTILCNSSILVVLESCLQTCMTYTIAVCTVNNSWWWTEELSETCRVLFQNKFGKLVHLVGFIVRKFVTMHGHMNVKKSSIHYLFPNTLFPYLDMRDHAPISKRNRQNRTSL
jgi:hypothetical protein